MKSPLFALCLLPALLPARALALTCDVSVTAPVSFGDYEVTSTTALDTAGEILIQCSGVVKADVMTVDLSAGYGSYTMRELRSGSNVLYYNLYLEAGRTTVWGDGSGSTGHYGPIHPPDGERSLSVFGRIPAEQPAAAGTYGDTVVVTVNF